MTETSGLRLGVLGIVVVSLFSALFARLWYLQVLDTDSFVQAATSNQVRFVYEEAPRGRILDRHGRIIVDNRRSPVVTADRTLLKDHPDVIPKLAAVLNLTPAELQERVDDPRYSGVGPVPVAEDIPEDLVVYLREHADEFPGIEQQQLTRRSYPHGILGAHALGYVGEINSTELESRAPCAAAIVRDVHEGEADCYLAGHTIGKSGVELAYEAELRGKPGFVQLEVDAKGKIVRELNRRPAVQGYDIQLTIDLDVQRVAEESLVRGLEAARRDVDREERKPFVAPAGSVVAIDPRDGGVVAMASFPTYDPAEFVNGISRERFEQLQDPAGHFPLNNRVIQGQYAPGSTFKLVTAVAALQHGLVAPNTTILDEGVFKVPRCRGEKCTFQNAGRRAWGRVNVSRALTVSSDVYFYSLGASFWGQQKQNPNPIQNVARSFGMGDRLGIELQSEKRGYVPDPDSRRRRHEQYPKAFPNGDWRTGDNVNMAIGQGDVLLTPLQLAHMYATFGNGGTAWRPHLGAKVLTQEGALVEEIEPEQMGTVTMDAAARAAIDSGLRGVTAVEDGTARGAFAGFPVATHPVAAKTGTAQVSRKQDTALFAAYAPAGAPTLSVAVIMEESGFGGSVAAPVARRIFDAATGRPVGEITVAGAIE